MNDRESLYRHLKDESGMLESPTLARAFQSVDRAHFVEPDYMPEAYEDYALPIGFDQTISQPTTVAFMLELLEVEDGNKVLDVGSGSGWTTVLLANLVGPSGSVLGLEIVPELVERGKRNLAKYSKSNARIEAAQKTVGKEAEGPFDRILVNAAAEELPEGLLSQLSVGGILVIPIKQSIWKITRKDELTFDEQEYPGFAFVPLV